MRFMVAVSEQSLLSARAGIHCTASCRAAACSAHGDFAPFSDAPHMSCKENGSARQCERVTSDVATLSCFVPFCFTTF